MFNRNKAQQRLKAEAIDREAIKQAVWALTHLYGKPCPDFDPDCKCCQVNVLIKEIRELFE